MNCRNSVIVAALFVLSAVSGFACGDAEPKEIVPNATANNTSANNTSANNTSANNTTANNTAPECTINGGCTEDEVCMAGVCVVACLADFDCPATEVCEGQQCVPTCGRDADCLDGEICGERLNGVGLVCVPGQANNETPGGCADAADPNAFCEDELGASALCNTITGECVENMTTSPYTAVQIQDVTTDFLACDTNDPGSDLQGVELTDASGNSLGWADLVWDDAITVGNDEYNPGIIDGTPPNLGPDGCVDSFSGNVFTLGCGGWIAVDFLDESGNPVAPESGDEITIYEYGGVCSTGSTSDEYTVALCTGPTIVNGDDSSCTEIVGTSSGVTTFTVF